MVLQHFDTRAGRTAFLGMAALVAGLVVASLVSVSTRIGKPFPGFVVWSNRVVPAIGSPTWTGTRAGVPLRSVVLSLDGGSVDDAPGLRRVVEAAPAGTTFAWEFLHDGAQIGRSVPSQTLRWRDVLPAYLPYLLSGCSFLAMGFLVLYLRPRLPAAHAALALGLTLGGTVVLALDLFSAAWLERLYFVLESLTAPALLHLALCFPEPRAVVRRNRWLPAAVYLPFVALAVAQNLVLRGDPVAHLAANDLVYSAIGGAGLVVIVTLARDVVRAASPLARQQAKIVLAGATAAALVPAMGILAIVTLGLDLPMNVLSPFFVFFPASIAWAIGRHDLFSADRVLRLGVVYVALSVLLFGSYVALVVGGEAFLGAGRRLPGWAVPTYLIVVLLVFEPLRARVQTLVDRVFFRHEYSHREMVEATSRVLVSVLDRDRIARGVLAAVHDEMGIEPAILALLAADGGAPSCFCTPEAGRADAERGLAGRGSALAALAARERPWTRYEAAATTGRTTDPDEPVATWPSELGASLAIPLRFEGRPIGALLLGEKLSGRFYTSEDFELLATLANQAALALTNARAAEVLREQGIQLAAAERMAAVGELAAAVAHGIRNPLAGIRAAAQLAREDVTDDVDLAQSLDDILGEADRLERRVRSVLELARPAEAMAAPSDLATFLAGYAEGLRQRIGSGIDLVADLDPALPSVSFDPARLTEVLDVLISNAVEAMAGHGGIRLRSSLPRAGEPGVKIEVSDTGPGIPADRLERVFDLFYTSKPSGVGVGLAMARRLIERQGGRLGVRSEHGHGATFSIELGAG